MKKKGITLVADTLIAVLLILVAFIVLLGVNMVILNSVQQKTEEVTCEASFLASSMSKMFGKSTIDPSCRTRRITLTIDEEKETEDGEILIRLDTPYPPPNNPYIGQKTFRTIFEMLADWNSDTSIEDAYNFPYFEDYEKEGNDRIIPTIAEQATDAEKKYVTMRYNMDRAVTEEMRRCWYIVNKGKLSLFDNSWSFFSCGDDKGEPKKCESLEEYIKFWDWNANPSANFCVLCSRIKFREEVREALAGTVDGAPNGKFKGYNSIDRWMANHPWRAGTSQSYYEYLIDETMPKDWIISRGYSTDEAYAVVFVRLNFHTGMHIATSIINIATDIASKFPIIGSEFSDQNEIEVGYANYLALMPYSEMSEMCNYIVGSYI